MGNSSPATFENRTLISEVSVFKKKKHFRCVDNSKFLSCFVQTLFQLSKNRFYSSTLSKIRNDRHNWKWTNLEGGRTSYKLFPVRNQNQPEAPGNGVTTTGDDSTAPSTTTRFSRFSGQNWMVASSIVEHGRRLQT